MATGLLLEFEGVTQKDYETAGLSGDGVLIVTEVWDSEAHQERFMEQRLGPALQEASLPAPTRMLWVEVVAHHQPS